MLKIRFEKEFTQSPALVFAAITDISAAAQWDTEITENKLEPTGPARVGSKIFQTRQFMGFKVKSVAEIREFEFNKKLFIAELPTSKEVVRSHYQFYALENGGCKMVKVFELGVPKCIALFVGMGLRKSLEKRYSNLEKILNQDPNLHKSKTLVVL